MGMVVGVLRAMIVIDRRRAHGRGRVRRAMERPVAALRTLRMPAKVPSIINIHRLRSRKLRPLRASSSRIHRAECNKGHPNDLAHPVVEPVGDSQAERNGDRSERKHDEPMAERVDHREQETTPSTLGGATEVGDGSDVVPVEAVAQAKSERCQQ